MGGGKMVAEIFISPGGAWTLVFTDRSGTACPMASGDDWQAVPVLGGGI
jgi:predicted enzyme related to lactoylglutathione lyase